VNGTTYTLGDGNLTSTGNAWALNLATAGQSLVAWTYNVVVTAKDAVGNAANDSTTGELVITATNITTPTLGTMTITGAGAGVNLSSADAAVSGTTGNLSLNRGVSTTTPTLTGTVGAGETVTIFDTDGTTVLCTTTADGTGNWSLTTSTLSQGAHTVSIQASDANGNKSAASKVSFSVDTAAPALALLSSPAPGSTVSTDSPTLIGSAEPGATVSIKDTDGTPLGTVLADANGRWSLSTVGLSVGKHSLQLTQTDSAGNSSAVTTAPLTISTADTFNLLTESGVTGLNGSTVKNAAAFVSEIVAILDNTSGSKSAATEAEANAQATVRAREVQILQLAYQVLEQSGGDAASNAAAEAKLAAAIDNSPGAGQIINNVLKVNSGISDQVLLLSDKSATFTMPENAFTLAKDSGLVTFKATLENNEALPEYVTFDPVTRTFTIDRDKMPEGLKDTEVVIKVKATDSKGRVAETSFKVKVSVQKGGITGLLNPDSLQGGGVNLSDQMLAASDQHEAIGQALLDSLRELNS
ncbi:MAG: Ig-like domain-containing protein, partial [Mariprofundaceae bacterium]|nr:Ig-like domain-containing protein [Mariprofundaceae bacterium]